MPLLVVWTGRQMVQRFKTRGIYDSTHADPRASTICGYFCPRNGRKTSYDSENVVPPFPFHIKHVHANSCILVEDKSVSENPPPWSSLSFWKSAGFELLHVYIPLDSVLCVCKQTRQQDPSASASVLIPCKQMQQKVCAP